MMAKRIVEVLFFVCGAAINIVAFWVIYQALLPIAQWYWNEIPTRGVDLTNAVTYVAYLGRRFALLPLAWKYISFAGQPFIFDYPSLHMYAALPFLRWFTAVRALELWMLVTTFAFLVFSYLLLVRLSASRGLALLLTIFITYSIDLYGALIWGGSVPYYGTQMFLPLTLLLLVLYFQSGKRGWFAGAVLALGISLYGHPQVAFSYGLPLSSLSILFAPRKAGFRFWGRIGELLGFLVLVFFIGLPVTGARLEAVLRIPAQIAAGLAGEIPVTYQATPGPDNSAAVREFFRTRIYQFYTDTHPWLFWISGGAFGLFLLAYFGVSFIRVMISHRKPTLAVQAVFWATVLLGYTTAYLYLYSIGIDIFHGGWYRVFWPVPLLVAMFAATAWGGMMEIVVGERERPLVRGFGLAFDGFLILLLFLTVSRFYPAEMKELLYFKSATSAGFPGRVVAAVERADQQDFAAVAVPPWLPANSTDYRLYSADQIYNIWFNAYYDMPLARGYIDPTITTAQRWGIFLTDIVLDNDVAVDTFGFPKEMAENTAKFVLDWNAIRYLEGESLGSGASVVTQFSSYLPTAEFAARDEFWKTQGVRLPLPGDIRSDRYEPSLYNQVRYLEIKEELVGPILSLTNAPAVLFVGDESYWEVFIRTLAQMGVTSRELIPVKGPKFLDQVNLSDLTQFESVVLYGYDYRNHGKAWAALQRYVESGGRVLIDTGAEVKESDSVSLPASFPRELPGVFPMTRTRREDLGTVWRVEASTELPALDFSAFSPLDYDGEAWNVSYAETGDVDGKAQVLLRLSEKPVAVSWEVGEGRVVWLGLNLAAHMERNRNLEEGKLWRRLLEMVVPQDPSGEKVEFDAQFIAPEKRRISGQGTQGVLFKESNFPGWSAMLTAEGGKRGLKIWRTGLGYPGVMWAPLQQEHLGKPVVVEFVFRGAMLTWVAFSLASLVGVVLFDKFAFNGKVFGAMVWRVWVLVRKYVGGWWEKEE